MTPLLLLPGMMCDARLFAPQIEAFSAERPIMTAPLCGHSSMVELATEILASAPPQFALAGLSMGGIVAMEILRQAPERVLGLALLDTNPLAETDEVKQRRQLQIEAAREGALYRVMREEMKPNYLTDGPQRARILDLCMDMAMLAGSKCFESQSIALRDRPDQTRTLRNYKGPSLVLCGRDDALCPVSRHELMHELLIDSQLMIIEQAGHLPTLEQPDATNAALESWLHRVAQTAH